MKIGDIAVADVLRGKTWRFVPAPDEAFDRPMEEWYGVEDAHGLEPTDSVLYSGVSVSDTGEIRPILLLKVLGDVEYGGDYCEFVSGRWRQVGLVPQPNAPPSQEYIANPSVLDPSFDAPDQDYRKAHQEGFDTHAHGLRGDA